MQFEMLENLFTIGFSPIGTVALAVFMLLLGTCLKKKVKFFQKYCIPAPVIGGVLFSLVNLLLYSTKIVSIQMDTTYMNDMQNMFFAIVAFGASFSLFKKGGIKLVIYFVCTAVVISLQGCIGMLLANVLDVSPSLGIVCGPAPLAGGHGSAASYGSMLEEAGYAGSMVTGMAAATFGLIAGALLGGPICGRMIRKHNLTLDEKSAGAVNLDSILGTKTEETPVTAHDIFTHLALVASFLAVGSYLNTVVGGLLNITLPGFSGPMIVALLVRNINEKFKWFTYKQKILDIMCDVTLGIFLSMAMISLNLWQLFDLAIPMLIIVVSCTLVSTAFIYFVVFRILGKDFDAAVMCAGLIGHSLGATPTGIANMNSVSEKYGFARLPFIIVPIVGGFLQDLALIPITVFLINLIQ